MMTVKTTASKLAVALWGHYSWFHGVEDLSRGTYPGTLLPMRKVPADSIGVLKAWRGGGIVEDYEGGWIADRLGPGLGHSAAWRAVKALKAESNRKG